jgi:hypothetical protein
MFVKKLRTGFKGSVFAKACVIAFIVFIVPLFVFQGCLSRGFNNFTTFTMEGDTDAQWVLDSSGNSINQDSRARRIRGRGGIITEERALPFFHGVNIRIPSIVRLHQSQDARIVVTAESNILPLLTAGVNDDNILWIELPPGRYRLRRVNIDVYTPEITSLRGESSTEINISEGSSPQLNISISGRGDVNAENFIVQDMRVRIQGSARLNVSATDSLDVRIQGSGNVNALNVPVENVSVSVQGSGTVRTWVTNSLRGSFQGSGTIHYRGDPPIIEGATFGSGRIRRID